MREHYKDYPSKNPSINHRQLRETLITSLWTIYDKIWKVRNTMLHDPNDTESLGNVELNFIRVMEHGVPHLPYLILDLPE